MTWTYDLDGTLLLHDRTPTEWTPGEMLGLETTPCQRALERVNQLAAHTGQAPIYITGRPERLRAITDVQLTTAGFPIGPLFMRPNHPPFTWAGCKHWKASVLRPHRPAIYVGDAVNDREAAQLAGVGYLDDEAFRVMTFDQLVAQANQVRENLARRADL